MVRYPRKRSLSRDDKEEDDDTEGLRDVLIAAGDISSLTL